MDNTQTFDFSTENPNIEGFDCSTCYDTHVLDFGGKEIHCEHCAHLSPSAVTIVKCDGTDGGWSQGGYLVMDNSYQGPAYIYAGGDRARCEERAARRRATIKATITRRANKATR